MNSNKIIKITHIPNLQLGTPNECHRNAFWYCMENNCNFVCGWILNEYMNIPHCIAEQDGVYIDNTLNKEREFKIYHTYTKDEIYKIFSTEQSFFIPFMGNMKCVYDGNKKLTSEDMDYWWEYIRQREIN